MSNWISIFILLAVTLINDCAAPPKPNTRSDFEELCQTLGKTDGKISKEDLLAAVRDKEQAEKIFDMCEKNKQGFLTVEEATRQTWAIRQLLMLYIPPKLPPPRGGRK